MTNLSKEIERRLAKLEALEAGGVDNWEWYGESLKEYRATIELEERADDLTSDICGILASSAYEPSERGAGVAFRVDAEKQVQELILTILKEQHNAK